MNVGTLFNIPDSEGALAQSTELEPTERVEHQRNDIPPGVRFCTNWRRAFPVPASHGRDYTNGAAQPQKTLMEILNRQYTVVCCLQWLTTLLWCDRAETNNRPDKDHQCLTREMWNQVVLSLEKRNSGNFWIFVREKTACKCRMEAFIQTNIKKSKHLGRNFQLHHQ